MSARLTTGLRWSIYCRISGQNGAKVGDADEDTASLETQEQGCRDLIARLDPNGRIVETHVYREIHTGVELFSRPKLSRLREAVRLGELDAIACYQPKRWARDPDHAGYLRTELREHHVTLRYAIDDPGDGEAGALVGYVHHWSGKQEHRDITERTHRARVKLVHLGHAWAGCKAPYGLRWRYETSRQPDGRVVQVRIGYEPDPLTVPILRGIFEALLGGASLRGIAADLNTRGIASPKGGTGWSHIVVKQLLTNRVSTGEAHGLRHRTDRSQEHEYIGVRGASRGRRKYRPTLQPAEQWVKLPDGYAPCIVDAETFDAAQQILAGKRPGGRQPTDPTITLMAGRRTRCADCGRAMSIRSRSAGRAPVLMCTSRGGDSNPCATRPTIRCAEIDAAVRRLARLIYTHPEVVAEQAALHRANDPTAADLMMIEKTLAEVERQQRGVSIVAAQITDADAAAPLVAQLERLAEQKRTGERDRAELLARRAGWDESQRFLDTFALVARRMAVVLDRLDHAGWQEAIDALQITAVVQRSAVPDERYALDTRFEGETTRRLLAQIERYDADGMMMEQSRTILSHHQPSLSQTDGALALSWTAHDLDRLGAPGAPGARPRPPRAAGAPRRATRAPAAVVA